jgi:hypothetical protein
VGDVPTITINLPASLCGAFQAEVCRQALSEREACRRIIWGLSGLTDADLRSLPEPPREYRNRSVKIDLDWRYLDKLSEATRVSRIATSSIFRRILHGLLITRQLHFVSTDKNEFRMEIRPLHFEFAEDYERDGPIPLLSRQHRELL